MQEYGPQKLAALFKALIFLRTKMAESHMSFILDKLGLSQLKDTFSRRKSLSLVEFVELGLTSRKSIMELRVECTVYGQDEKPRKGMNSAGRAPKFIISKEIIHRSRAMKNLLLAKVFLREQFIVECPNMVSENMSLVN